MYSNLKCKVKRKLMQNVEHYKSQIMFLTKYRSVPRLL